LRQTANTTLDVVHGGLEQSAAAQLLRFAKSDRLA
jgi:hypothetical protein